jgi:L-lactate dehydrogenase
MPIDEDARMADDSRPDLSPAALGRLVTGMTPDQVEAVVGRFHRPNLRQGRPDYAWIGSGAMLRAFFDGPGGTLSAAVLDVPEEQRALDLGENTRRRLRRSTIIQTWYCVACRERYRQPQSGRPVVCTACNGACERVVAGLRVPSKRNAANTIINNEHGFGRQLSRRSGMKVGIVGSGFVGATAAYALVMQGVGREIVLVDKNTARAAAEADDIRHAVPFAHPLDVVAGGYEELVGCRVIVLCAGVGQKPGETRLQLLQRNAQVFREIVPAVLKQSPDAVLVVATNPVDVMTHLASTFARHCGVPAGRVLGSGTTLDTARFRSLLGGHCGVDPHHVHAYVIGEHGDSEVLTWSLATIGGMPLEEFARLRRIDFSESVRKDIDGKVRGAAYTIISGKSATYYGIGSALARIVDVILHDQRAVMTVGAPTANVGGIRDVTVSLPRLLGGQGILETFPLPLNETETGALRDSAAVIRKALDDLGAD